MEERKQSNYTNDDDSGDESYEHTTRTTYNNLTTPRKLFVPTLTKEVYMMNKTLQLKDIIQNSTDDERLIIYAQMEEEYQLHVNNPTWANTPQIPASTGVSQGPTPPLYPTPSPYSSPLTRITDKESVVAELKAEADTN